MSERVPGEAGTGNLVDLQPPMYVITSLTQETGSGTVTTEYLYKGLKAERGGRGLLGFRETRQQNVAPDGSALTVATEYLQKHPYIGVAAMSKTHVGTLALTGSLLSKTVNSYCDKTSAASPTAVVGGVAPAPCETTSKVQRPYLFQSVEEGWDLTDPAISLPKVTTTNTFNSSLDPLVIEVSTTGNALSPSQTQTFTKTTTNTYKPDNTAVDSWILGRLETTTVRNVVPNALPSIATVAGSSPSATGRNGSGPPPAPVVLPPAVLNAILQLLLDD